MGFTRPSAPSFSIHCAPVSTTATPVGDRQVCTRPPVRCDASTTATFMIKLRSSASRHRRWTSEWEDAPSHQPPPLLKQGAAPVQ